MIEVGMKELEYFSCYTKQQFSSNLVLLPPVAVCL